MQKHLFSVFGAIGEPTNRLPELTATEEEVFDYLNANSAATANVINEGIHSQNQFVTNVAINGLVRKGLVKRIVVEVGVEG